MMRLALSALAVLLFAPSASAYSIALEDNQYVARWTTGTVNYQIQEDGTKAIAGGDDLTAVEDGAKTWNNVTCSNLFLNYTGTTASKSTLLDNGAQGQLDGFNRIVWLDGTDWQFGSSALAVTLPVWDIYGVFAESDIAFNDRYFDWDINHFSSTDIESVAVHEIGHFFGLQHVIEGNQLANPPTMAPIIEPGLSHTLTADDELGICFLYPAAGSYTCDQFSPCPKVHEQDNTGEWYSGELTCEAGACEGFTPINPGEGELGNACIANSDCANNFCITVVGVGSYCSQSCSVASNNCPTGFGCIGLDGGGGACISDAIACTCDTTFNCDAPCLCDPECGGGCACDTNSACQSGCACDTDCTTCACNVSLSCNAGCACDPDCGGGCSCDLTTACDYSCSSCDPECPCDCDRTIECDAACDCDPECLTCACDTTNSCDANCACDRQCVRNGSGSGGSGCAATSDPTATWLAALLLATGMLRRLALRRRRR